MSTRPRNPHYFPRMKVRGARRRRLAPMQRISGSFDGMVRASVMASAFLTGFGLAIKAAVEAERVSAVHQIESQPLSSGLGTTHAHDKENPSDGGIQYGGWQ